MSDNSEKYSREKAILLEALQNRIMNPNNSFSAESLERIKAQYEAHPIFEENLYKPKFFSPKDQKKLYHQAQRLKKLINASITAAHHDESHDVGSALTNLLGAVLDGESPTLFSKSHENKPTNLEQMLMQNEYWVGPMDPESVGLSDAFKTLSETQQSILGKFSSSELKSQFLNAFPWATGLNNLKKLEEAKPSDHTDLLGYEHPIGIESQLVAIQFLLLAFDTMGKLSGHNGTSVLKNYPAIDSVVTSIEALQADLENVEYSQSPSFLAKTQEMVKSLQYQNKQLHLRAKQENSLVSSNEAVNNFCHLNEQLMYIILGLTMETSILSPVEPSETNKELIENSLEKNPYYIEHLQCSVKKRPNR